MFLDMLRKTNVTYIKNAFWVNYSFMYIQKLIRYVLFLKLVYLIFNIKVCISILCKMSNHIMKVCTM